MISYSVRVQTKKIISFFVCFIIIFFSVIKSTCGLPEEDTEQTALLADSVAVSSVPTLPTVVIDPGHGGIDGGASSKSGVVEKEVNLQIGTVLYRLCNAFGIGCVMTRYDDRMLGQEQDGAKRKMKDLRYRVNTANSYPDFIFVSIHQNKFPIEKYSGLQVYYSKNILGSYELAKSMQDCVKNTLQPQNTRAVKPSASSIYVLDNIRCPGVLVECGFLSNNAEAALLADATYQKKLSCCIFSSIFNYISDETNEK